MAGVSTGASLLASSNTIFNGLDLWFGGSSKVDSHRGVSATVDQGVALVTQSPVSTNYGESFYEVSGIPSRLNYPLTATNYLSTVLWMKVSFTGTPATGNQTVASFTNGTQYIRLILNYNNSYSSYVLNISSSYGDESPDQGLVLSPLVSLTSNKWIMVNLESLIQSTGGYIRYSLMTNITGSVVEHSRIINIGGVSDNMNQFEFMNRTNSSLIGNISTDNVGLWRRPLSIGEKQQLYNNNNGVSYAQLYSL